MSSSRIWPQRGGSSEVDFEPHFGRQSQSIDQFDILRLFVRDAETGQLIQAGEGQRRRSIEESVSRPLSLFCSGAQVLPVGVTHSCRGYRFAPAFWVRVFRRSVFLGLASLREKAPLPDAGPWRLLPTPPERKFRWRRP